MAGRPRKPTALHILTGSDKKHPDRMRERANEPKPTGELGACPKRFGAAQKEVTAAWKYIAACCPAGVLTDMDRPAVMQAAALLAEFWRDPFGFPSQRHARLHSLLASFGMTPATRSKVVVPKPDADDANPFARFRGARPA